MNVLQGDLPERLAAEYVLGTLHGAARRRFEVLLPAHPALRQAVSSWEQRLLPMALKAGAIAPPPAVWARLEARLGWAPAAPLAAPSAGPVARAGRRALRFWQAFSAVASLAVVLLATLLRSAPLEAPMVVVLRAQNGSDVLVAGLSADRQRLSIQPLQKVALAPERALELWALPKSGPPASLGLIRAEGLTSISRKALPADTQALAVSLEPPGGSPTGAPTGPVLFVGQLTL